MSPQKLIHESTSPDEKYSVRFYLQNSGATTSLCVLGRLTNNETKREKNIYWQNKKDSVSCEWKENHILFVNGVTINVLKEVYDYRKAQASEALP